MPAISAALVRDWPSAKRASTWCWSSVREESGEKLGSSGAGAMGEVSFRFEGSAGWWRGSGCVGGIWECGRGEIEYGRIQEAITRDPEVMHGIPVFRGTRVPAKALFDYLENGESLDDFLGGFPTVSRDMAVQVLEECIELRLARVSCEFCLTTACGVLQPFQFGWSTLVSRAWPGAT
jgi:uncharacterized protein (DUF433 family)